MDSGNISFFTLSQLADVLSVDVDSLLLEARLGNLVLCAETDSVNCKDHHWRLSREMYPDMDHAEWHEHRHVIWLSSDQVAEITRKESVEVQESSYPLWVTGSLKEGQIVYRDETVIFEDPCIVTTKDLLVLDGDAATFYCATQNIQIPSINPNLLPPKIPNKNSNINRPAPSDKKQSELSREPMVRPGGSFKIYPIAEGFIPQQKASVKNRQQTSTSGPNPQLEMTEMVQAQKDLAKRIKMEGLVLNFKFDPPQIQGDLALCIIHYLEKYAIGNDGEAPKTRKFWAYIVENIMKGDSFSQKYSLTYDNGFICHGDLKRTDYAAFDKRIRRMKIRPIKDK